MARAIVKSKPPIKKSKKVIEKKPLPKKKTVPKKSQAQTKKKTQPKKSQTRSKNKILPKKKSVPQKTSKAKTPVSPQSKKLPKLKKYIFINSDIMNYYDGVKHKVLVKPQDIVNKKKKVIYTVQYYNCYADPGDSDFKGLGSFSTLEKASLVMYKHIYDFNKKIVEQENEIQFILNEENIQHYQNSYSMPRIYSRGYNERTGEVVRWSSWHNEEQSFWQIYAFEVDQAVE